MPMELPMEIVTPRDGIGMDLFVMSCQIITTVTILCFPRIPVTPKASRGKHANQTGKVNSIFKCSIAFLGKLGYEYQ